MPDVLLAAYRRAVDRAAPGCHLPVSLLAAIGQVESGSLVGRRLSATHAAVPPVFGPVLDGVNTAAIRDTDGGRLDGNRQWDRAVGPMQFLPGTWAGFGVDADGDGRADPQNVYDAAAAAADYLCAGGRDMSLDSGLRSAILSYNHSSAYLASVLAWQGRFAARGGTSPGPTTGATSVTALSGSTPMPKPSPTPPPKHSPAPTSRPVHGSPGAHLERAAASRLAWTTAPSPTATSGSVWAVQPVVAVLDDAGNTVSTDTSSVTLTLTSEDGATLTCAADPLMAVGGVASFNGCMVDLVGSYTLTATDGSLTPAISPGVTITAAAASRLSWTTSPSPTATSGSVWAVQPVVAVLDDAGNTVSTDASSVTLTLTSEDGATLTCAADPLMAGEGVASFSGCMVDLVGSYTLTATDGSLTPAIGDVTITTAPPEGEIRRADQASAASGQT